MTALLRRTLCAATISCALATLPTDALAADSDDDGIQDADEAAGDSDGDGLDDVDDDDDDDDCVPTREEGDDDADDDGVPDHLDAQYPTDLDEDGFPSDAYAECGGTDCDDTDPSTYPGQFDQIYDGRDRDCSGGSDYDADGDGYDSTFEGGGDDCDDNDPAVHPGAVEDPGVGDVDCDGWSDSEHALLANGGCDCGSAPPSPAVVAALLLLAARRRP